MENESGVLVLFVSVAALAVVIAFKSRPQRERRAPSSYFHFGAVGTGGSYTSFGVRATDSEEAFRVALDQASRLKRSEEETVVVGLI
jgi:hypothetical protein